MDRETPDSKQANELTSDLESATPANDTTAITESVESTGGPASVRIIAPNDESSAASRSAESQESPARSPGTIKAYTRNMRDFEAWCTSQGVASFPATGETLLAYLSGLLRSGRRPRGMTRIATAVGFFHREAGLTEPCPSSTAVVTELRARVPEAFVEQSPEESQDARQERQAVLDMFVWLERQVPASRRMFAFLRKYVVQGRHRKRPTPTLDELFDDDGVGQECETTCCLCGAVVARGREATDRECRAHRCG